MAWHVGLFPYWSPLLPYMADGTAHYAEKVGDTQHFDRCVIICLHWHQLEAVFFSFILITTIYGLLLFIFISVWIAKYQGIEASKRSVIASVLC